MKFFAFVLFFIGCCVGLGAASPQGDVLRRLYTLFGQTKQAVDNRDLNAAVNLFHEGYYLLLQMPPYVQHTPAAPIFNQYIQRANELEFKIRNGYVTLQDFRQFLSPLSNIVSSVFGMLKRPLAGASSVIGGGFNAVFDDINGMANGLQTAINSLSHGDILGAITGGIGSAINGKLNAIGSLINGFGGLLG